MSREIKRIDIREFREQGFLQEANRLFFHPHGLALEIDIATEPAVVVALTPDQFERLRIVAAVAAPDMVGRLDTAEHRKVGDMRLSGVWDDRDDPEGVVFGDGDQAAHAERVAAQRSKLHLHRSRLFGNALLGSDDSDIEPVGWVYPEGDGPA